MAAGAGAGAADGRRLSRADPRPAAHHRDAEARGGRLQGHAGARPQTARRGGGEALVRRALPRRGRRSSSTTPTAFRSTSPRTCCARATARSRSTASTRRWSGSAPMRAAPGSARARRRPSGCGSSCARRLGATRVPGLRHARRRGQDHRHHRRRQGSRRGARRHRGGDHRQPDAVLRRIRRADGRYRRDVLGRGRRVRACATRRRRRASSSCISAR